MLSNVGNGLVIFNVLLGVVIIYYSLSHLKNEKKLIISKNIYSLSLVQCIFSILSFLILIFAFVISDFSLITVYQHSHTLKPLFYKISGSWGNHEGSLLLWINVLIIFSYFFLILNKESKINFKLYTLISQNILILGFLCFLLFNSNPFSLIYPEPKEGLGLNPILQDPALAIHPPLLYIGFVGSSIYFSAAISSLVSGFKGKKFAQSIKPWIIITWSFQTLGITVGSIWAYYELGWGGFWFWDPVENVSLMPWFVMTALLHSVTVLEKRDSLYSWVIILSLLTFTLSVTGTFLVRSGIFNSVHTFANDPSRGVYLLALLSLMVFSALTIFLKENKREKYDFNIKSKETFLLTNNWLMMFYLATVLVGTVYPIFIEVINQTKISVGPPYYNIVLVPLVIPLLILMALGPNIKWIKGNFNNFTQLFLILGIAIFLNLLINYFFNSKSLLSNFILISSIFLIFYSIIDLIKFYKIKSLQSSSRIISHLGFGLLIFFIGINHNFSTEEDFNLKVGDKKQFNNYTINFLSLKLEKRENYESIVGLFKISDLKKIVNEELKPEIRIYSQPKTMTHETSIKTKLTHDLYLTMSNVDQSDLYNIKFQKKPFMIWIWISAFVISFGGFMRFYKKD